MNVSWEQALAWRMRRQYLIDRASPKQLVAVVDRLRGLHAQVMSSVDLALWARIEGLQREAIADALWKKRTLIKMWAMSAARVARHRFGDLDWRPRYLEAWRVAFEESRSTPSRPLH